MKQVEGFPPVVGHCQLSGTEGERVCASKAVLEDKKVGGPAALISRCICLWLSGKSFLF
jgi:hypothetical protein